MLLLITSGLFTAAPLLLFANAVKEVKLSVIGLLQFLAPTAQFLLGVLAYDESFDMMQLVGIINIWSALINFVTDIVFKKTGIKFETEIKALSESSK